ncbi:MAG: hypothetical protein ACJARD_000972 [Alphaproteobacteria bacterium]|jgi:hypothetical protein
MHSSIKFTDQAKYREYRQERIIELRKGKETQPNSTTGAFTPDQAKNMWGLIPKNIKDSLAIKFKQEDKSLRSIIYNTLHVIKKKIANGNEYTEDIANNFQIFTFELSLEAIDKVDLIKDKFSHTDIEMALKEEFIDLCAHDKGISFDRSKRNEKEETYMALVEKAINFQDTKYSIDTQGKCVLICNDTKTREEMERLEQEFSRNYAKQKIKALRAERR